MRVVSMVNDETSGLLDHLLKLFPSNPDGKKLPALMEVAEQRNSWGLCVGPSPAAAEELLGDMQELVSNKKQEENLVIVTVSPSPIAFHHHQNLELSSISMKQEKNSVWFPKKGCWWSELKGTGMVQWGRRRQVRFLWRHEEKGLEPSVFKVHEDDDDDEEEEEAINHNSDGAMEYWLESADLVNIRKEVVCARELIRELKEELTKMNRDMQELVSNKKQEENLAIVTVSPSPIASHHHQNLELSSILMKKKQTCVNVDGAPVVPDELSQCGLAEKPNDQIIYAGHAYNDLAAVEYIYDIYKFYKLVENECRPRGYMESQPNINEKMRAILFDWLIEVHSKFELMLEQIWAMDKTILGKLEWNLTVPTPYVLLVCFIKAYIPYQQMENMVYLLAELGMMHYATLWYCPSMIAASAVYAAQCTLNKTPIWNDTQILYWLL